MAGVRAYELLTRYFHLIAEGNLNRARGTTSAETALAWSVYLPSIFLLQLSTHIPVYDCHIADRKLEKFRKNTVKKYCETDSNPKE
jgi:hypothetical protein